MCLRSHPCKAPSVRRESKIGRFREFKAFKFRCQNYIITQVPSRILNRPLNTCRFSRYQKRHVDLIIDIDSFQISILTSNCFSFFPTTNQSRLLKNIFTNPALPITKHFRPISDNPEHAISYSPESSQISLPIDVHSYIYNTTQST